MRTLIKPNEERKTAFAQAFSQLFEKSGELSASELSKKTEISESYISSLRRGRNLPTESTLGKLAAGIREIVGKEKWTEVQFEVKRVVDVLGLDWENFVVSQLGEKRDSLLLSIITSKHSHHKDIKQFKNVQDELKKKYEEFKLSQNEEIKNILAFGGMLTVRGKREIVYQTSIGLLLEGAMKLEEAGTEKHIYLSWFSSPLRDEETKSDAEDLEWVIRRLTTPISFLKEEKKLKNLCTLFHLYSGSFDKALTLINEIFNQYIGTGNRKLYEIQEGRKLPDLLLFEGVGCVVYLPQSENEYSILLYRKPEATNQDFLEHITGYIKYLINSGTQLLESFRTPSFAKYERPIAEAEANSVTGEVLLIKDYPSVTFRPKDIWMEDLRVKGIMGRESESTCAKLIDERHRALETRLKTGKSYYIHPKEGFKLGLKNSMVKRLLDNSDPKQQIRGGSIKEQSFVFLKRFKSEENCHVALADIELIRASEIPFELCVSSEKSNDRVFFQFEPFDPSQEPHLVHSHHPQLIDLFKREFKKLWQNIPEEWRTDSSNPNSRRNIIDWIVIETLKALIEANAPTNLFWEFAQRLVAAAMDETKDKDWFNQELFFKEIEASSVLVVASEIPVSIAPEMSVWNGRFIQTRQKYFDKLLSSLESYHLILSKAGVKSYQETGIYSDTHSFGVENAAKHIRKTCDLLKDNANTVKIDLIPQECFLVNFEIIEGKEGEFVFFESVAPCFSGERTKEGGLILKDTELAKMLKEYAINQIAGSHPEPERISGADKAIRWMEELIGTPQKKTGKRR